MPQKDSPKLVLDKAKQHTKKAFKLEFNSALNELKKVIIFCNHYGSIINSVGFRVTDILVSTGIKDL